MTYAFHVHQPEQVPVELDIGAIEEYILLSLYTLNKLYDLLICMNHIVHISFLYIYFCLL